MTDPDCPWSRFFDGLTIVTIDTTRDAGGKAPKEAAIALRRRLATGSVVKAVNATATLNDVVSELERLGAPPVEYVFHSECGRANQLRRWCFTQRPWLGRAGPQGWLYPEQAYYVRLSGTAP